MKVKEFLESASSTTDFVVCALPTGKLLFGVDNDLVKAIVYNRFQIESEYSHILDWEVKRWHISRRGFVWIDAEVPTQSMQSVIDEFFEYTDSLGVGALL